MIMVLNNGPHEFISYSYCFSICTEMSLNQFLTGSHNHAASMFMWSVLSPLSWCYGAFYGNFVY